MPVHLVPAAIVYEYFQNVNGRHTVRPKSYSVLEKVNYHSLAN
jgi:hypothetical protein